MATLTHTTPPRLDAPAYAADDDGTMVHRYLGTDFADQFLAEARAFDLPGTAGQSWRQTDRFGKYALGLPTLRLPIHQAFHMVVAEVACDEPGRPALDPRRVASAGFVIRRGTPADPLVWLVKDGVPLGWRRPTARDADPDERRRLASAGLMRPRPTRGPFTGEETYPLRPLLVDGPVVRGSTARRKRTLLHGFLPLSGTAPAPLVETPAPDTISGRLVEHQWPFGSWDGTETDTDPTTDALIWTQANGLQILDGRPEAPMEALLRTLVARYQIQEDRPENARLRALAAGAQLRTGITGPAPAEPGDLPLAGTTVRMSLLAWIEDNVEGLVAWFGARDRDAEGATPAKLPGLTVEDLYIAEAQALNWREALVARGDIAEQDLAASLPVPRFGQGPDEIFFVRPFLRYLDDCGCERVVWGPVSKPFRVLSPMDPEASVPQVIQMPDLDDVRRGIAKGVTFLTPKSLMDAIDRINPDMEFKEKKGNAFSVCLSYSLSFSIPIITICAMILLMIILNLLNFFLKWLPYAFLRLSLKCK
ncbi:MAG: hypothetical protein AAGA32_04295 [Pseudomonadota bacterium]